MGADRNSAPYYVVEWSGGGGLGHYAYLLAEALAAEGGRVTHITRRGHEMSGARSHHAERLLWPAAPLTRPGVGRMAQVGLGRLLGWVRATRVIIAARRTRPVVHLQCIDQVPEIVFAAISRALGARVIATVHNMRPHDARPIHAWVQKLGLKTPHAIVVHTSQAAAEIRRSTRENTLVHTLGHPSYRRLVELMGPPRRERGPVLRVGALGMIRPYKGLEFVVDAFCAVQRSAPPCQLRVAGRASDGRWVKELLADAPCRAISSRIEYLTLPDFIDEVQSCDVLLLGHRSLSESGVAQLALGAGVPVIGPRIGALARLLEASPEWLYEPGDREGAVIRLSAVLGRLAADRDCLRSQALAMADVAPTWPAMAQECLAMVHELRAGAP